MTRQTILIVDDEPEGIDLLDFNLKQAGYAVASAADGADAVKKARALRPDLIILDVMLPDLDGFEVCKMLRRDPGTAGVPIILLTAKAAEIDRVVGLELGADDYVTKPFSPRELVLRIKKLFERTKPSAEKLDQIVFGELFIDIPRHIARWKNKRLELTATEFRLLAFLAEHRGRVQSRADLLRHVWAYENTVDTRTVDTHMRRLREKFGGAAVYIETVRGVGYRFAEK